MRPELCWVRPIILILSVFAPSILRLSILDPSKTYWFFHHLIMQSIPTQKYWLSGGGRTVGCGEEELIYQEKWGTNLIRLFRTGMEFHVLAAHSLNYVNM